MADLIMHPTLLNQLQAALEDKSVNQWREIAEQTRDQMVASLDPQGDRDILHSIREGHIAFGAACAFNAAQELGAAIARADELSATFDLQHSAQELAIKRWQEAHPGNDLVWPDHADLVVWLMEQHVVATVGRHNIDAGVGE